MPNPAAVSDLEKFLSLLEGSTLLNSDQLAQVREVAPGLADAKAVARHLIQQKLITKWQATQLLVGWNSFSLGKYRLLNQVGSSEQGRTYLAEHAQLGRKVLLRTLPRRAAEQPDLLQHFLADARSASSLDHRNIVHVFDVNSEGDRYYLVMENVEGRDLFSIVSEEGPLPAATAIEYLRQAVDGLAYAHAAGVLHKELSPGKLLIDSQGTLKILELGIPGLDEPSATASTDLTSSATNAAAYLAPEQCNAAAVADSQSDIYSLGATLYYLLSGKSPLAPSSSEKPRDLLQLRSDLPEALVDLCQRMMATNPEDRFASVEELKPALADLATPARAAAPSVRRKGAAVEQPSETADEAAMPVIKPKVKVAKPIDESAADSNSGGFPVIAKSGPAIRPTKKAAAPIRKSAAPAAAAPVADEAEPVTPAAAPTKAAASSSAKLPIGMILGGIAGTLAMMTIGGLGVFFLFLGGGSEPKTIAKNDVAAAKKEPVEEVKETPAVEIAENEPETKPGDEVASATLPTTEKTDEPKEPAKEETPKPDDMKAEEKKPDEKKEEEKKPEDKPAEEKKPEPKPEPKPAPKPEPPPPPAPNPFAALATSTDLPALTENGKPNAEALQPVLLGQITAPAGTIVFARMAGGEKASKGKSPLTLMNANNGTAERQWEISTSDAKAMNTTVLARLELKDDQLMFNWTQEALATPAATGLPNCVLLLSAGPQIHRLTFRKPIEVAPLALNLEKAMKAEIAIPNPPDPSAIRVEVLKADGTQLPMMVETGAPIEAEKGTTGLVFGKPLEQVLILKFDAVMKQRDLVLSASTFFKVEDGPRVKFNSKDAGRRFVLAQHGEQQIVEMIKAAKGQKGKDQKEIDRQVGALEAELKRQQGIIAKWQKLQNDFAELNGKSQLLFRVYYAADDAEKVDLVTSTGVAPASSDVKTPGNDVPGLNLNRQ